MFDPLGDFAPTVLDAKLFMKTLWIDKCEWDVKLNEKQLEMWLHVIEALRNIPTCHLHLYLDTLVSPMREQLQFGKVFFLVL